MDGSPKRSKFRASPWLVVGSLACAGLCWATIFSALSSTSKSVKTSFGPARVDESKDPPEISVGELRSIWKGTWQLGGGKIEINHAEETDLVLHQPSATFKFKVRWVAGNEAMAQDAHHKFRLKVVRLNGSKETVIDDVKKDVSVGGKGMGGTVFTDGSLSSKKITVSGPAQYRIVLTVRISNCQASLDATTVISVVK